MPVHRPITDKNLKVSILLLDFIVLFATFASVFHWRMGETVSQLYENKILWTFAIVTLALQYIFGTYDIDGEESPAPFIFKSFVAVASSTGAMILITYLMAKGPKGLLGRGVLIGSYALFFAVAVSYRLAIWSWLKKRSQHMRWLVIAPRKLAERFKQDLKASSFWGQIYFCLDEGQLEGSDRVVGHWSDLDRLKDYSWSSIIVAVEQHLPADTSRWLMEARFDGQAVLDLSSFYEKYWKRVPIYYLRDNWFFVSEGFRLLENPIGLRVKRLFDLFLSFVLLLVTWPIMLIAMLIIRIESRGAAIFKQTRTGKDGKNFTIYKFRSMRVDAEKDGAKWAQKGDDRITGVGKFIRLTRIDELPQLWNVFRGDMSFIGPRPERPEFNVSLEKELPYYNLRHLVRPGITGWAQILYPYGASVEDSAQKLQYELFYIKNYSFSMDMIIVLKTIRVVLFGRGR